MKRTAMLLIMGVVLLAASQAGAVSTANHRLEWFVPLTGGAGGSAASTNYAVDLTVGQSAVGTSASTGFRGCLGYWCLPCEHRVFLPLILRLHS